MKRIKIMMFAPAIVLVLLAGCSASGRPSEGDLSKAIQKTNNVLGLGKVPAKQANCLAIALLESKLSDETLNAIADADAKYRNSNADAKIMVGLGEQVATCGSR